CGVGASVYWGLAQRPVNIRYEILGDAPYVEMRYTRAYAENGDISGKNIGDTGTSGWFFDLHSYHSHDPGEFVVTIPSGVASNKSATCVVFIDAVRVRNVTATGAGGVADCSGF
ncbi:hypothetical protein ACFQ1S_46905, partial [Kibdelosporangium lantanae]